MSSYDFEIGLDLHKVFSLLATLDRNGTFLGYQRLDNSVDAFDNFFGQCNGSFRVTFECCPNWYWVADYCQEHAIPFILSNPLLNRAIAHVHAKNDRYDARMLAHLAQTGLIATCYVPDKNIRHLRELLFHRLKLLQVRTRFKNRIHVTLIKYNFQSPYQYIFGPHGIQWIHSCKLPPFMEHSVCELLELIAALDTHIEHYDQRISDHIRDHPYYQLLRSVYGIGIIHAATIIARVADITRFPTVQGFIRYAGLAVNTRASADKLTYGHLMRQSDKYLRTSFVEASHLVIRYDPGLRAFYDHLAKQKGHGCAICAVARKLARSVYFMLKNSTPYRVRSIQGQYVQQSHRLSVQPASASSSG